jgi:type IV/VI secretion system ImpK/VasF family protein
MTLIELCEPLFQYICRLNRSARKGGSFDIAVLRHEITALFERMKAQAAEARLVDPYEKMEMPLLFFVDSMIAESKLPLAGEWNKNRLAYQRNELAGDEKFFDLLDQALADPSEAASERLAVFYTCIGLGFQGWYAAQPDYLQKKMKQIAPRIAKRIGSRDASSRICAAAYENVDTRDLIEPPSRKLVGIVIALVGLTLVLFITNMILYHEASQDLSKALRRMLDNERVLVDGAAASAKESR